jgi:hypothetical protein
VSRIKFVGSLNAVNLDYSFPATALICSLFVQVRS